MIHLLDTSALLAHARGEPGAERVQSLFERKETTLLVCSLSLAEMARRLRDLGATPAEAWEKIESYRQALDEVVAVDEVVARESDRISQAASERLPLVDSLIAAAARVRGAVLVHRDAHLRGIPETVVSQLDLVADSQP